MFADLRADAPAGAECEHVLGEVVDLDEKPGGGAVLALQDGRALDADLVVLAVGHLPGAYPIPRPLPVYQSSRYVHAPWSGAPLAGLSADDDILIVGQGLTAVDLIVQLAERGHRGKVHALSRHGVQPRVHAPYRPHPAFLASEPLPTSVRTLVRRVREEISAATRSGSNWRAVIDGLRPYSQALWRALSLVERRRFLRHVRPLWEVHRHRIAPQAAALVGRLVDAGRLVFHAGRLQTLDVDDGGIDALIRCRGSIRHLALRVGRVFNCSGPRTDYSKYQHPLLVHLLARGLIDHDPLALGVDALPGGEVLRYRGGPVGWLYTLGAPLRGIVWESTAVREIRAQASALAEKILAQPAAVELAAAEG